MSSVKLYKEEELYEVQGLYVKRGLEKMGGSLEVYSTLLDKFLNELPRTIPKLRQFLKANDAVALRNELKALRIDLADIFALNMLSRADTLYDAAEKGDLKRCNAQMEAFISSMQSMGYEIKQCRTQDLLENAEEAAQQAAELDIGAGLVNNRFSTVPKGKFVTLYKRVNGGLLESAANLANVLKAMGYDSEINNALELIKGLLAEYKLPAALDAAARLLTLMGASVPPAATFHILALDAGDGAPDAAREALNGEDADTTSVLAVRGEDEVRRVLNGGYAPGFLLLGKKPWASFDQAGRVARLLPDTPSGFVFESPTPQDIMAARKLGAVEYFTLPLDAAAFAEKMRKYRAL